MRILKLITRCFSGCESVSSMHKNFLLQVWILIQVCSFHAFRVRTSATHFAASSHAAITGGFAISTTSTTGRSAINATNSTGNACTLWDAYCQPPVPPIGKYSKPWGPFWAPSAWGPCSHKCGRNGTKTAIIDCYSTTFRVVDASNCAHLPIIRVEQPCNRVPCPVYQWYESPWTECSKPCDIGTQMREVVCVDNLGTTGDPDYCGGEDAVTEFQYCNVDHCSKPKWHGSEWSNCTERCGGGSMTRRVQCLLNGTAVSENSCFTRDKPPSQRVCSPQPCHVHTWLAGPWSNCSTTCGSNTTRIVQCVDEKGKNAPDVQCPGEPPATSSPCPPALLNCTDCAYNNCSGNGYCPDGQRCLCSNDWQGRYCEKAAACETYLGVMGFTTAGRVNCCATIDANYTCCRGAFPVLDGGGNCCESGVRDACGICNGTGLFVDSLLQCCSTVRDEKGICCYSGVLDECYICDGDGLSCAATLTLTLGFTTTLTVNFKNWQAFTSRTINNVGSRLNIANSGITMYGLQVQNLNPDCTIDPVNCGQAGIFTGIATFILDILPIARNISSRALVRKADIEPNLIAISATSQDEQDEVLPGAEIISIANVSRLGVCGNGLCEIGERCTALGRSSTAEDILACCPEDCPYVLTPCASAAGATHTCSGHGICMDTTGHCDCFVGYAGADCSECLTGWQVSVYGGCLRVPNLGVMRQFNMEYKQESGLSTSMVVILLGILGGCTYLLVKHQKTIAQLQPGPPPGLNSHPSIIGPPPALDTHEDKDESYDPHDHHHDDENYATQKRRWRPSYLGQQSDYDVIPITPRPPAPTAAAASNSSAERPKQSGMIGRKASEERRYQENEDRLKLNAAAEMRRETEIQGADKEAERDGKQKREGGNARPNQGANKNVEARNTQEITALATWEQEEHESDWDVAKAAEVRRLSREREEKRRHSWKQEEDDRDAELRRDVERRRASREKERLSSNANGTPRLPSPPPTDKRQLQMTNLSEEYQKPTQRKSGPSNPVGNFLTDSDSEGEPEEKLQFNDLLF